MALKFDEVKDIVLEELRAKGYSPNPGDVLGIVNRLVALSKEGDTSASRSTSAEAVKPPKA